VKNTSNEDILHEMSILGGMYRHFQQIIWHRCVRAFRSRCGCTCGTRMPVKNIAGGEKPAGPSAVPWPMPRSAPDARFAPRARRPPRLLQQQKKPHLKW